MAFCDRLFLSHCTVNDFFDPFGVGSGVTGGSDLFDDLLGSEGSGFKAPPPATNSSLFNLSKTQYSLIIAL